MSPVGRTRTAPRPGASVDRLRFAFASCQHYEHMPLRRTSMPRGPAPQLFRQFAWGGLASFFVLDTRQYGTDQPCGDESKAPCEGVVDPAATLLGVDQERWHKQQRGYVVCTVTPKALDADYRVVPFVTRPDAPLLTPAWFVVTAGRPGVERVG